MWRGWTASRGGEAMGRQARDRVVGYGLAGHLVSNAA